MPFDQPTWCVDVLERFRDLQEERATAFAILGNADRAQDCQQAVRWAEDRLRWLERPCDKLRAGLKDFHLLSGVGGCVPPATTLK